MTATEPTLDALLASTPPQPYQPEDLGGLLDVVQRNYGLGQHMQDRYRARDRIMQHVNGLRVDVERARLWATTLEGELADVYATLEAQAIEWANTDEPNGFGAGQAACGEELRGLIARLQERAL